MTQRKFSHEIHQVSQTPIASGVDQHMEEGLKYMEEKKHQEAYVKFKAVLTVVPNHEGALTHISIILEENKQYLEIIDWHKKSLVAAPRDVKILKNLMNYYMMLNHYEDALIVCNRILDLEPNYLLAIESKAFLLEFFNQHSHLLDYHRNHKINSKKNRCK